MSRPEWREVDRIARRVMRRALRAPHGRRWYAERRRMAEAAYGVQRAPLWLSCYAACSQHSMDAHALRNAGRAFSVLETGEAFEASPEGWGPAWRTILANLERVRVGVPIVGPKLRPFERALHGDPDAVVLDRWMFRAAGFEYVNLRRAQGRRLEAGVRTAARRLGWSPAETQAATWTAEKEGLIR